MGCSTGLTEKPSGRTVFLKRPGQQEGSGGLGEPAGEEILRGDRCGREDAANRFWRDLAGEGLGGPLTLP